jgi:hypothetical protein
MHLLASHHYYFALHILRYIDVRNCAILGYYAASSDNFVPTFRDNLSAPTHKLEERSSQPVGGGSLKSRIFLLKSNYNVKQ